MVKLVIFFVIIGLCQATVKINVSELRCLVCKASLDELLEAIERVDPNQKVDVGGYRLDEQGNLLRKTVPQAKSETHLSDMIDEICGKLEDYVRGTWKTNGTLTIMKLLDKGGMNPAFSQIDVIQDDDLNRSLKYYCEGIMEEFEENIIEHIQQESADIHQRICHEEARLCSTPVKKTNEEL